MATLDHSNTAKDGRPRKVAMQSTAGKVRVVKLPPLPVRVTLGPSLDTAGTTVSGTLAFSLAVAGTWTDNTDQVTVADNAVRYDLAEGQAATWVINELSGPAELAISTSVNSGYTQIVYERT